MYASQNYQSSGRKIQATTEEKMKVFVEINLLMGIKSLPSFKDYRSTSPELHEQYIRKLMPVNRFSWFLNYIHINDNNLMKGRNDQNFGILYKIPRC